MNAKTLRVTPMLLAATVVALSGCAGTPPDRTTAQNETCWRVTAPGMGLRNQVLCGTESQWAGFSARAGISPDTWKEMEQRQHGRQAPAGGAWTGNAGVAPVSPAPYLPLQPDRFAQWGAL